MISGLLLINKEKGYSSRDYIFKAAKKLGVKKFGHIGTLDPFATGLLVAALNRGTKIVPLFEKEDKTYRAKLKLGISTETGDIEGNVLETKDVPNLTNEDIDKVLQSFKGKINQTPPIYSAIKVNGKPLYHYALHGIEVEIKSREVEIYEIKLLSFIDNIIEFEAKVSSGTYIRTLGEDIAKKLGTVGHLIELIRLTVGDFKLEDATDLESLSESDVLDLESALKNKAQIIDIVENLYKKVINGNEITLENIDKQYALLKYNNEIIALYEKKENATFKCVRGLL